MSSLFDLTIVQWLTVAVCGVLVGFSRTGVRGSAFLAIPLFAQIFGGRSSAGLVLLILISGDLVAVRYYLRNTEWRLILRLAPSTLFGLGVGVLIGGRIDDQVFVIFLAVIVLVSAALLVWREFRGMPADLPKAWWFAGLLGFLGGFTSMIGNAAGPIMNLYFLSMGLDRRRFVGTVAWFFFLMNITKVPLHIVAWDSISLSSLLFALALLPAVLLGTGIGVFFVKKVPERPFRLVMLAVVVAASLRLLLMP